MDGYGYVSELPAKQKKSQKGLLIFQGNTSKDNEDVDGKGIWASLKPGHGIGFNSDGKKNHYSNRFGVELTFAETIQKHFPDRHIAIIKYSRGGTSIAEGAAGNFGCWEPDFKGDNGVNQYDHFLATVRNAYADSDIDDDGEPDRLIPAGIVWMQGESDANYTLEIAERYQYSLRRLMNLIRACFRTDNLPIVIGRISNSTKEPPVWKHGEIVRTAQATYAGSDANVSLIVTTDNYGYSDRWHYDSPGYIDLGRQFATAIAKLEEVK